MKAFAMLAIAVLTTGSPALATGGQTHAAELNAQTRLSLCRSAPVTALRFIEVGRATLWRDDCAGGPASLQPPLLLECTDNWNRWWIGAFEGKLFLANLTDPSWNPLHVRKMRLPRACCRRFTPQFAIAGK